MSEAGLKGVDSVIGLMRLHGAPISKTSVWATVDIIFDCKSSLLSVGVAFICWGGSAELAFCVIWVVTLTSISIQSRMEPHVSSTTDT